MVRKETLLPHTYVRVRNKVHVLAAVHVVLAGWVHRHLPHHFLVAIRLRHAYKPRSNGFTDPPRVPAVWRGALSCGSGQAALCVSVDRDCPLVYLCVSYRPWHEAVRKTLEAFYNLFDKIV